MQRLGRAKQRYARAAQHYAVEVAKDATGTLVSTITWTQRVKPGSAANPWKTDPGVYCLRTTLVEQDNATLWRTYTMLTNLESVFRSLKTDRGLRPVFHQIDRRVEGHLFISVRAYHFVHTLRLQLKAQGNDDSWEALRQTIAHAAARDGHLATPRWPGGARAQGHSARAAPAKDQRDAGPGAQPWRHAPRAGLAQSQRPLWRRAGLHKSSAIRAKLHH